MFRRIFLVTYLRPFSVEGEAGEGVTASPHRHLLEPVEAAVIDVHPLHKKYSSVLRRWKFQPMIKGQTKYKEIQY